MVFDDWLNGVPVAYIITSSCKQPDLEPWMRALATKLAAAQEVGCQMLSLQIVRRQRLEGCNLCGQGLRYSCACGMFVVHG